MRQPSLIAIIVLLSAALSLSQDSAPATSSAASKPDIRDIAAKLPIRMTDKGVDIGGKTYDGGLVMVYPNPANPKRYVLISPEDYPLGSLLALGDYVVAKSKDRRAGVLTQGYFDSRWQLPATATTGPAK